jgi:hypothetical protein
MKFGFKKNLPKTARQADARSTNEPLPINSYYYSRSPILRPVKEGGKQTVSNSRSETADNKRVNRYKRWLMPFGLVALIIVVLAVVLGINGTPKVVVIEPTNFNYEPHTLNQYRTAAANAINSSLFNKFKLTFSSSDIADQLKKEFPEIEYASSTYSLIGPTPVVYIQLYRPELIYISSSGQSYILNHAGDVIASSSSLDVNEQKSLAKVTSTVAGDPSIGSQVLTSSDVAFIATVWEALNAKSIAINKMSLVPMAEELDVYPAAASYFIKFNLHETDALQQVGTYLAAIATIKQQHQPMPTQYVDVRVDGRAYYK